MGADKQMYGKNDKYSTLITSERTTLIYDSVRHAAESNVLVLISGEFGVGKRRIAREIHKLSQRNGHFVSVNCIGISERLERELFGSETGFEYAKYGTVLLNEISGLRYGTQKRLLKVLQDKMVLGESLDARVIATTRNLVRDCSRVHSIWDLYSSLSTISIHVPPLRERLDEIAPLAEYFLQMHSRKGENVSFSQDALTALRQYGWPGNLMELEGFVIHNLKAMRTTPDESQETGQDATLGRIITSKDFGTSLVHHDYRPNLASTTLDDINQDCLDEALRICHGHKTKAAELLSISIKTVHNMLDRRKRIIG